jgi:5-methylcytosine-specific restriction endonuclease McrA
MRNQGMMTISDRDFLLGIQRTGFMPFKHARRLRSILAALQHDTCPICSEPMSVSEYTLDHFVPRGRGGQSTLGNLMTAHEVCNRLRGDQDATAGHRSAHSTLSVQLAATLFGR